MLKRRPIFPTYRHLQIVNLKLMSWLQFLWSLFSMCYTFVYVLSWIFSFACCLVRNNCYRYAAKLLELGAIKLLFNLRLLLKCVYRPTLETNWSNTLTHHISLLPYSRDTSVKLWDSTTREEIRNLTGHSGTVTCVQLISEEDSDQLSKLLFCVVCWWNFLLLFCVFCAPPNLLLNLFSLVNLLLSTLWNTVFCAFINSGGVNTLSVFWATYFVKCSQTKHSRATLLSLSNVCKVWTTAWIVLFARHTRW